MLPACIKFVGYIYYSMCVCEYTQSSIVTFYFNNPFSTNSGGVLKKAGMAKLGSWFCLGMVQLYFNLLTYILTYKWYYIL